MPLERILSPDTPGVLPFLAPQIQKIIHAADRQIRPPHHRPPDLDNRPVQLQCVYCRTGTDGPAYAELTFDEYLRMARLFVDLGITKIRLTGGEPLLRNGLVNFVRDLAKLRTANGTAPDIALTTNGHLLAGLAQPLNAAGLHRVTVSL